VSKTDLALWLGIYAGAVASATGLWTLFRELWLDRARINVEAREGWLVVTSDGGKLIIRGEETLETMGIKPNQRLPILEIAVRNRGRRDAQILHVSQRRKGGGAYVYADAVFQVPFDIPAERTHLLALGKDGGYVHGDVPPRHFFVVDGANRIHPLRERYRHRLRRLIRRKKRQAAESGAAGR
jgi:hypothetical protein